MIKIARVASYLGYFFAEIFFPAETTINHHKYYITQGDIATCDLQMT